MQNQNGSVYTAHCMVLNLFVFLLFFLKLMSTNNEHIHSVECRQSGHIHWEPRYLNYSEVSLDTFAAALGQQTELFPSLFLAFLALYVCLFVFLFCLSFSVSTC